MFSYYGKISTDLYNFTKPVGTSINGDIEYYTDRLAGIDGSVLEAGVGTGRLLIPLLEKGFEVDGIDYSPDMLQACKQHCEMRGLTPTLYEDRLEDFQLPCTYKAIIMPTGSFCLLPNREAAVSALTCFKNHLKSGGRIIIDVMLPYDFKVGEIATTAYPLSNGEGITLEKKAIAIDWINQKTESYLKYEKWKNGKLVDTELQEFTLTWYGIEEFRLLLKEIGFKHITCSSGYVYGKFPTDPNEIITFEAEV